MAGIFNRAYDQANRILNGSGLSSIVYRFNGGGFGFTEDDVATMQDTGVEETVSDTFDMSDWSGGGDILGGGLTPKQAQGMTNYIYGKDPGADDSIEKALQRFDMQKMNQPGGLDYSEKEILSDYYKDYPVPPDMVEKAEVLDRPGWGLPAKEYEKLWSSKIPMELSSEFWNLMYNEKNQSGKSLQDIMDENRKAEENRLAKESGHESFRDLLYDEGKKMGYSFSGDRSKDAVTLGKINDRSPLARSIDQKVRDKNLDHQASGRILEKFKDEFKPTNQELSKIPYGGLLATSPKKRSRELLPHELQGLKSINLATGGKVMPRGLSGINKTININGQPHSLAWINPGEASALKAMGGSGKKVDGIPAYYFDDPGYMMEEIESYYDPVDHGTDFTPAPLQYGDVQYLSSDGQTTTPDRFGASGLTSNIPIDLSQADLTNEEAQALGQMHQSQVKSEIDRLLEGVPLSQEGSGRSDFKGLAQLAAQEAIPGASDTWDFEAFAENYPWLMPGAAFVKGIGWIMGKDPNPVVSSYNMGGKIYNVYMDGTVKEQRKDEDYGDDGNEPVKKKFPLKKIAAAGKEEEKELTGMAALLDKREKKPTEVEALLPQFKTIVAAGFSEQEAAKMLDVSLADMLKIY